VRARSQNPGARSRDGRITSAPSLLFASAEYNAAGNADGTFLSQVVVIGSNKTEIVPVREVPFTTDEEFRPNLL
jgi:hypothetical protein